MPSDPRRRSRRTDRRGGRTLRPAGAGPGRAPGPADPLIGHTVGGHKILQRTGSDAICALYKANHAAMARLVTFKALKPEAAADEATLARFYETAKAAAQVHHPNIVSLYDVSTAQNVHFCTMEYVEGRTVGELLRARQKIASDDAVRVAIDVAEGLRFANAKEMPGFRLSADRVLLSSRGEVKILPPTLTPPDAAVLDEAYVLRAVGTLLYAMLSSGRVENLEQALDPDTPAPSLQPIKRVAMGTRKSIADVVDRLVGSAGAQPYPDVEAALADLREVLQKQEKAEDRTRNATERAQERQRHGLIVAGAAIGVAVAFGLLVLILVASRRSHHKRRLRDFRQAEIQANDHIKKAKELYQEVWNAPTKENAETVAARYAKAKDPWNGFIAAYPNTPDAQEATSRVAQIDNAIATVRIRLEDRRQYIKELNAYNAVRKAFDAEVERKLKTGGLIDEDQWRRRYADLLKQFPNSPRTEERVERVLRNLKAEIQRAEMKIEVNKLVNDFRVEREAASKESRLPRYGKALAAWEKFRKKYDKIDHVRKDALANAQTKIDDIKRDARVGVAQMMNRANYLAREKKDYAKARALYQVIIDNVGIPRHVEKARAALAKLPK